jgi:branched-chain amino acid transport system permease protein
MTTFLIFAVLGFGAGVAYVTLAFGVVVIYKGSGVLNFSHGAIAMFAAFMYADLTGTSTGQAGLPKYVALLIVLLASALFGTLLYFLVMRPLRAAPVLSKVVATLGVLLLLQGVALIHWGAVYDSVVPSLFPTGPVSIGGGVRIGQDRLWALGLAVVVTAGLWLLYNRTNFGLATRGVAESEKGAALLGYSPGFIASINWALGCALAGLAGVIIAPVAGLDTATLPLMILPAFAAALIGRFRSFGLAALVALLIGIGQSELVNYWSSQPGVTVALPLVVVFVAMIVGGRLIPQRGALSEGRPPQTTAGRVRVGVVVAVTALGVIAVVFGAATVKSALITTACFAILALSVVVITGYMGQISLAQMTFAGISGFFLSKLASDFGVPFPLSILVAALLTIPVGVLVGLPALRVRGINLAVVTLGLAYAVDNVVFQNPSITGGDLGGIELIPSPTVGGYSFDAFLHPVRFALFAMAVLIAMVVLVSNVRRSSTGRKMLAVRSNERAAAAVGISVARMKLQAFALAAFIAGVGGGLLSQAINQVTFSQFSSAASFTLITIVVIGGIASIQGAMIAGLAASGGLLSLLFSNIPGYENYYLAIGGLLLILTVIFRPDGVSPEMQKEMRHRIESLTRLRQRVAVRAPTRSSSEEAPETALAVPAASLGEKRR